jgi:hypothetical protein
MTTSEIYNIVKPFFKREFDPTETMRVLTSDMMVYFSWGVSKKYNFDNKGLLLKVSGNHHKGFVLITLDWMDTYTVHIISNKGEIEDVYENVFFDELTEIIDKRIERIPDYVR